MSISNDYGIIGMEFFPFDDTQNKIIPPAAFDAGGYDTREVDNFRQGVEIATNRQRFAGMMPKIWSGNLLHYTNVTVIGQARSFTEYDNSALFVDLPIFNPVNYIILGNSYPLPIVFNEGPQQEEEVGIEPITIPFRKNSNEGRQIAHRVYGSLEDGNNFQDFVRSANRVEQFIPYKNVEQRYFLDDGANYIGNGPITDGIIINGYISQHLSPMEYFNDLSDDDIAEEPNTKDTSFTNILKTMDYNINEDIRPNDKKSSNAGFFVYGGNSSKYGTDSIAYIGRFKGA